MGKNFSEKYRKLCNEYYNGHSTGYFSLKRGTRQGDPLSAYLFILCVETIFIQIRENPDIKGIRIGTEEINLSAYADDADFLTPDVESLELIFQTCDTFQSFSSLKLNLNKSEACWIGAKRGSNETLINCKWININCNAIRSLGIFNSYDTDLEEKLNFVDNLKSIKEIINIWKHRGLSLAGRILIFKSLALSKVLYASTMKCPSKQVVDQLNVMQRGSIWNNKKSKIKHSTLVADYSEGGYKDIDIRTKLTALKVAWVTKFLDDNFHPWKVIPTIMFTIFGGINNLFHHNFKASKQCRSKVNRLPKFYQELIQQWSEVGEKSVQTLQKFVVKYSGIMLGLCPTVRPFTISILLTKVF